MLASNRPSPHRKLFAITVLSYLQHECVCNFLEPLHQHRTNVFSEVEATTLALQGNQVDMPEARLQDFLDWNFSSAALRHFKADLRYSSKVS
jgi:hypothetical protein